MAKFYGCVGYSISEEVRPGIWKDKITEKYYYIDIIRNTRKLQSSGNVNDDINISNEFSMISDAFANENFHNMKYISYMNTKWKISNIDVQYPRLILSVNGVYHG